MSFRYGFELEGFFTESNHLGTRFLLPPVTYPTDGFPGLVELRTTGHNTLLQAFSELLKEWFDLADPDRVSFKISEHTFTAEQKRALRKRVPEQKNPADIRNIYGKKPRPLGNKTMASLQINISNIACASFTTKDGFYIPDRFALFDVGRVVKRLDQAFKDEILKSNRQMGEYAIKGDRLEYRRLPNTVLPSGNPHEIKKFLDRVRKA